MDVLYERNKKALTKEAIKKYIEFKIKPNNVIINTPVKCGTTWIQMICHSLRSKGEMSFEDINQTIPYVLVSHDIEIDLEKDQGWKPHIFKYHSKFEDLPTAENVKYILCIRNPIDAAISDYNFIKGWILPDEVTISEFLKEMYLKKEDPKVQHLNIWNGILNLYAKRHDPNVLYLHYEDLKENLREGVKLIAKFLEIDANDELIDLATKQADLNFMKKHHEKFNIRKLKMSINKNIGIDPYTNVNGRTDVLVRSGKSGQSISKELDAEFEKKWNVVIEKELGFKSYEELRKATNVELNRPFIN